MRLKKFLFKTKFRNLLIVNFLIFIQNISFSQFANESNIPFNLNTDGDIFINVIDTDDDNDGVLDNLDAFPLDNTKSTPNASVSTVSTHADAGLRSTAPTTNYGTDATVLTRSTNTRSLLLKFTRPSGLNLSSAVLTIWTNTENDSLDIYIISDTTWTETGVNYSNAPTSINQFLGSTATPSSGKYTFTIPLNKIPSSGSFTIWVHDHTNESTNETIYTKETAGKASYIDYTYFTTITPRLIVTQNNNDTAYLAGSPFSIDFKLSQAPTDTVYIPLEVSDTAKASITGDKVLMFTPTNWNTNQTKTISMNKIGLFHFNIRPLHSNDTFYNGFNQADLNNYRIQASNITNLSTWTVAAGSLFSTTLNTISAVGSTTFTYKLFNSPIGMGIVENNGKINFRPLSAQVGTWTFLIEVKDDKGNFSFFQHSITVTSSGATDPVGKYVVPYATVNGTGTASNPFNNIVDAVNASAVAGGGNVFVRGGVYDLLDIQYIDTQGTVSNPIIIQPLTGEVVKFNFGTKSNAFEFRERSRYITFKGFEIDGGTDNVDFWCLPAQAFWGDKSVFRGGGIAIGVNGQNITLQGNYIHHCYQKAIEIRTARYLKVYDNIIHSIATTSLSGGHGIMRQQSSGPLTTPDTGTTFRWDLQNNLIFNVEQRIYSWVPSKGYIDMVLDEGKPILVDDPADDSAILYTMKARIMNNIVAYGAIDQIRLKSTPNLTVSNNTVYSASPQADGITDKVGDAGYRKFTDTKILNNAVQTMNGTTSFDMADILAQGVSPYTPPTISGNYTAVGNILPSGTSGITATTSSLFVNPNSGNFRINPSLGLPSTLGVKDSILDSIDARVARYAVQVKWDQWNNDHLKLTQTILDNIPGVNDGIIGNETVFPDYGSLVLNTPPARSEIHFNVIAGTQWKTDNGAPANEDFELHTDYAAWYKKRQDSTKINSTTNYKRIRWGNSIVKQNQSFLDSVLTHSQIYKIDSNTIIEGLEDSLYLNGDILIDFEGYTPTSGNSWYLMKAKSISTLNSGGKIFDSVKIEGATLTPSQYTLSIINIDGGQALKFMINPTPLPVTWLSFSGESNELGNTLKWQTASELNSSHFEVQRSIDAINFEVIGTVQSIGNSKIITNYQYNDFQYKENINYYRLKQIDNDNKYSYSKIIVISSKQIVNESLYPNPVIDKLYLSIKNNSEVTYKIIDFTGKLVFEGKTILNLPIDVSNLTKGIYFISFENSLFKFIKQ